MSNRPRQSGRVQDRLDPRLWLGNALARLVIFLSPSPFSLISTLFLRFQSSPFPASALHYSLFFVCTLVYVLGLGLDRVASGALVFLGANDLFFRFPGFCISHYGQEEIEGIIQAVF